MEGKYILETYFLEKRTSGNFPRIRVIFGFNTKYCSGSIREILKEALIDGAWIGLN